MSWARRQLAYIAAAVDVLVGPDSEALCSTYLLLLQTAALGSHSCSTEERTNANDARSWCRWRARRVNRSCRCCCRRRWCDESSLSRGQMPGMKWLVKEELFLWLYGTSYVSRFAIRNFKRFVDTPSSKYVERPNGLLANSPSQRSLRVCSTVGTTLYYFQAFNVPRNVSQQPTVTTHKEQHWKIFFYFSIPFIIFALLFLSPS